MMGVFVQTNEWSRWAKLQPVGYLIQESGCWDWVGHCSPYGYATLPGGRTTLAHRMTYELAKGPIPVGLEIDHLCRNKKCVNPDHLEAVTPRENVLRGIGPSAQNARKTQCKRGHWFASASRTCYECHRITNRLWRIRVKESRAAARRTRSNAAVEAARREVLETVVAVCEKRAKSTRISSAAAEALHIAEFCRSLLPAPEAREEPRNG